MSKCRIIATFDFECDAGDDEEEILEGIRGDIQDVIDCWETSNIKVLLEDEYCINNNDKKTN